MSYQMDRFEGYIKVEPEQAVAWEATVLQLDGFFYIFCAMCVLYIFLAQLARHRRQRRNHNKLKQYWAEQRQTYQPW